MDKMIQVEAVYKFNGGVAEPLDLPGFTVPLSRFSGVRRRVRRMFRVADRYEIIMTYTELWKE